MYGPCDPKWGSWFDTPEWALRCYARMMPRIEAERTRAMFNAMLATNGYEMEKAGRAKFLDGLDSDTTGDPLQGRPRVKPTPGFLARLTDAAARSAGQAEGR